MRIQNILRLVVILEWVFLITGLALSFALEGTLPLELRNWLASESERPLRLSDIALLLVGVPLLIADIVASVGLLFLQKWAAWLYLVSNVGGYLFLPFTGPSVDHAVADTMDEISTLLTGVVLTLAFFTTALEQRKRNAEPPPPLYAKPEAAD